MNGSYPEEKNQGKTGYVIKSLMHSIFVAHVSVITVPTNMEVRCESATYQGSNTV